MNTNKQGFFTYDATWKLKGFYMNFIKSNINMYIQFDISKGPFVQSFVSLTLWLMKIRNVSKIQNFI